jgi:hypothetical protein
MIPYHALDESGLISEVETKRENFPLVVTVGFDSFKSMRTSQIAPPLQAV